MTILTQEIFKDAPTWVLSASIDGDGDGFYHSLTIDQYAPTEDGLYDVTKFKYGFNWDYEKFSEDLNTDNWRNSAINRIF